MQMVARGRLTDAAYQYVREGILRGELPIGSVLGESELARRLGSSRTPVRQALGRLLQEGLVEIGSKRQAVVRGYTAAPRGEIQLLLEEIDQLRLLLIQQRRAARAGDEAEFLELDERFHLRIADGARLPILRTFLGQLRGFVRVVRLGGPRTPGMLAAVVAEHERIVDALERRDEAAASKALVEHLHKSDYAITPVGRARRRRPAEVAT